MNPQIYQSLYQKFLRPGFFALELEQASRLGINLCRQVGASPLLQAITYNLCGYENPQLIQQQFGLTFPNPVGLAAGFDKNAEAIDGWSSLGFGFVEVGTITAQPQPGNPPPRLFRLPADYAALNRMGFNNCGAEAIATRLRQSQQEDGLKSQSQRIPLGINLGKSKVTPIADADSDYLYSFRLLQEFGDYFVVNVSSPNTPNLRDLQATDALCRILEVLQKENHQQKPIFVKIAPDLNDADIIKIAEVSLEYGMAGLIATNTTIVKETLQTKILAETGHPIVTEAGGISGVPVRQRSLEVIRLLWQSTNGKLPIIGVGGIFTAADAWAKIMAGACLVQVYTGWIYEGPFMVANILQGLVKLMASQGYNHISEVIGAEHRQK
ncbi:MAG: quinone-dependent dihydroorotate dehydrogenase [Pseudanabaena sp. ELA607]